MKRAIAWFAENPVAANLLLFLIVAMGVANLPAIQQRMFPELVLETIMVNVEYRGAAPEEVEEGVCIRVEEALTGIDGIERIVSTALEGRCTVLAELISGANIDRALAEIKNEVDGIDTFPQETEKPVVEHIANRTNALQLVLSGKADERALRIHGERLRDEISALPGVTQVDLAYARDYEISIEVPEASLRRHELTFDDVVRAVRRSSLDLPGGSIRAEKGEILLRAKGQAYVGADFERIVVLNRDDGTRLLLADIANVVDGFEEVDRFARLDGEPAVMIRVFRVGDQKVLDLVETVLGSLDEFKSRLPDGLSLTVWRNESDYLRQRLQILINNGAGGFALVFLVLAFFLRLRLAFWVAIGMPASVMGALGLFPPLGISIDVLSLFAFILVLGILVDNAIVVGENIHTHQQGTRDAAGRLRAAITGAQEVSVPVVFGLLTTVTAFLPMMLSPGFTGDFFGTIGKVVTACLFLSLISSQWVLPAHLGRYMGADDPAIGSRGFKRAQARIADSLSRLADGAYRPALRWALEWRYATVALAISLLAIAVAVVATGRMGFSYFPAVEGDYVAATVKMPPGTPVERTAEAVGVLEASALRVRNELNHEFGETNPLVRKTLASIGAHIGIGGGGMTNEAAGGGAELGAVAMELMAGDRPIASSEVARRWRDATPPIAGVDELRFTADYLDVGDPVDIQLRSSDVEAIKRAAATLKERLADYPGVLDIGDTFQDGKEEMKLTILPQAEALGLTLEDLARQVRQAFYGAEAQRVQRGRDDVRVMVRYPESNRRSLADLDGLRVRSPQGGEVPFYAVARAEAGRGFSAIHRTDRQRVIDVTADVDVTVANANEVLLSLQNDVLPDILAHHPGLTYSLEGEQREQSRMLGALARNYTFALFLIYALLAVPLRSYGQPVLIMGIIPFGLVGAIGGHFVMGLGDLSQMSLFGVVALSGVLVNSSLILMHQVNQRRDGADDLGAAVVDGAVSRFRPIVLTTLTTFAGLTPLLLESALGAQFVIPMATSLAFGVVFATAISLFLLPAGYLVLEDIAELLRIRVMPRLRAPR